MTIGAFLWSLGLLLAALVAPAYGTATLVGENGARVLAVVAVPTVVSVMVWVSLWRKCARGARGGGYVAWTCIAVLAAFCLLAILSVGIYVVPVALLLAWAALLTPSGSPGAQSGP